MPELVARYEDLSRTMRWLAGWCVLCVAAGAGLWLSGAGRGWAVPLVCALWFAGWRGLQWATSLPVRVQADREGLTVEALRVASVHGPVNGRIKWPEVSWFAVAPASTRARGVAQSEVSVGTATRKFLLVGDMREVHQFYVRAEELRTGVKWEGPPRRSE